MKTRIIYVLVFCILAVGSAAATFWLLKGNQGIPQETASKAQVEDISPRIEAAMENFTGQVNEKALAYRQQRKVLSEMARPENLRTPEYIGENFNLMQSMIPELRLKMNDLLQAFESTEQEIQVILQEQPEETRQMVLNKWQPMKEKQMAQYVNFFAAEEEILGAYQELMAFYKDRSASIQVDPATDVILFENPEDQVQSDQYWEKIRQLTEKQSQELSRP